VTLFKVDFFARPSKSSVTPFKFGIIEANDSNSATIRFPTPGTGDVVANTTGAFNATCTYPGGVIVQDVANCTITPNPADVGYKELNPK
jgi:hypothetical protein